MGVGRVENRGGAVVSDGGNTSVADDGADGAGARWRDVCRFSDWVLESSVKISHIVSHSRSISAIPLCRLACKEDVL